MNKKSNLQYVFVVVALLALQGGFIGMLVNCTGILLSAVMADMGFTAGKISLYYTVRALAQAATALPQSASLKKIKNLQYPLWEF